MSYFPLLFQATKQGFGLELEQLGHEAALMWDPSGTGEGIPYYATVPCKKCIHVIEKIGTPTGSPM